MTKEEIYEINRKVIEAGRKAGIKKDKELISLIIHEGEWKTLTNGEIATMIDELLGTKLCSEIQWRREKKF